MENTDNVFRGFRTVAVWAHVGGFLFGLAAIKLFARPECVRAHRAHPWRPSRIGRR